MGLEQVAELHGQLDPMLRAAGYTQGSVGERMNALNRDPAQLYPNTDEGRAELLARSQRLCRADRAAAAAGVQHHPARRGCRSTACRRRSRPARRAAIIRARSLDDSRPGTYYINLRDTAEWPKYGLKTLTWHEGNPGHHFQGSIAREAGSLPLYRRHRRLLRL